MALPPGSLSPAVAPPAAIVQAPEVELPLSETLAVAALVPVAKALIGSNSPPVLAADGGAGAANLRAVLPLAQPAAEQLAAALAAASLGPEADGTRRGAPLPAAAAALGVPVTAGLPPALEEPARPQPALATPVASVAVGRPATAAATPAAPTAFQPLLLGGQPVVAVTLINVGSPATAAVSTRAPVASEASAEAQAAPEGRAVPAPTPAPSPAAAPAPATEAPSPRAEEAGCGDVPPPPAAYTCQQQAAWGKCSAPWMAGYCDRSCGRCGGQAAAG